MADDAADVAEDYRQALEDLTMNSRIEIATLTNIARENAHHGHAIAEVLQNHIKKVPPNRTLPALYVLDSVVKNVPTPYALYFGPKLYSIFMGAYAKVDNNTRKKMDEMLKTWKEPVPGSISTKPVFPPEHVRPIEMALIGARNAAYAANQNSFRPGGRPAAVVAPPHRETPTPPNIARPPSTHQQPPYHAPPQNGHPGEVPYAMRPTGGPNSALPPRAITTQPLQSFVPAPTPPPASASVPPLPQHYHQQQQPTPRQGMYGAPQPGLSIEKLKDDIQQLIVAGKADFAQDPLDTSKQTRLKALLDLQTLIQRQDVPQEQLILVRDRVAELAVNMRALNPPAAAAAAMQQQQTPTPVPPVAIARPPSVPVPSAPVPGPSAAAAPALTLDKLFGQGALATLLAGTAAGRPPSAAGTGAVTSTPPVSATAYAPPPPLPLPAVSTPAGTTTPLPAPQTAAPPAPSASASASAGLSSNPSALLAMLRQSGLLSGASGSTAAPPPAPIPTQGTTPTSSTIPTFPPTLPPAVTAALAAASLGGGGGGPPAHHPVLPPPLMNGTPSLQDLVTGFGIQLKSASLKQFRPHLLPLMYDHLGPPCTQCGRRFKTDEDGKRKKTAHMDWHFRVHQRIAEAEKRGQHRSWYVDETDWARSREVVDTDYVAPTTQLSSSQPSGGADGSGGGGGGGGGSGGAGGGAGGHGQAKKMLAYIPVPEDSGRTNSICPICQERFEMKWLDEAQEWVWMDAVKVKDRVYHASCHREAAGDRRGNTPEQPSSVVLGKRKAEDDFGPMRGKMKMEGY